MFSRARIAGHPIHPMIIPLPVTSFILGAISLIVFAVRGEAFWLTAGYWLSIFGAVAGLVAAVPGLVDWVTIPPDAGAKRIGLWHLGLNVTIVVLFFISWLLVGGFSGPASPAAVSITLPLALEVIGVLLLTVSGWLGWEMVYRHHVAIEPVSEDEKRIVESYERRAA